MIKHAINANWFGSTMYNTSALCLLSLSILCCIHFKAFIRFSHTFSIQLSVVFTAHTHTHMFMYSWRTMVCYAMLLKSSINFATEPKCTRECCTLNSCLEWKISYYILWSKLCSAGILSMIWTKSFPNSINWVVRMMSMFFFFQFDRFMHTKICNSLNINLMKYAL